MLESSVFVLEKTWNEENMEKKTWGNHHGKKNMGQTNERNELH